MKKFLEHPLSWFVTFCLVILLVGILAGCATTGESKGPVDTGTTVVDYTSYPELQKGDKNEYVGILQKALGLSGDGEFGPVTEQAVIRFQAEKGLVLRYPGTVGQKTWAALFGPATTPTPQPSPTPSEPIEVPVGGDVPGQTWTTTAQRKEWAKYIYAEITGPLWGQYSKVSDGASLCPKYNSLSKEQKGQVLTQMWGYVMQHESAWSPTSRMFEKTMGYYSEGLLQLSYVDKQWAKYCKFDKAGDDAKGYAADDPRRTILDPYINLHCGLRIMGDQLDDHGGKLMISSGVYWAVLRVGGKYTKIPQITAKTKAMEICQ